MILFKEVMYASPSNLKETILSKCGNFIETIFKTGETPKVWRGIKWQLPYTEAFMVSPTKVPRKSRNTENYYTLYIDNAPEWSEFPKRELICSTTRMGAQGYGAVYIVIPFDEAKFGVCPSKDIWDTVFHKRCSFNLFEAQALYEECITGQRKKFDSPDMKNGLSQTNWNKFCKQTQFVTQERVKALPEQSWANDCETAMLSGNFKNLYELFSTVVNPKDFRVVNYNKLPNKQVEVWTDSPCVLMLPSLYSKFIPQ